MLKTDVIIIGAGAAGLMCAIEAGKRKRRVLVLDHANKPGKKILMSGGGRCNFTNYYISPDKYISHNPHFCKSALTRYTQWDFIELVNKHGVSFHEKALGQLFCDNKAKDIVELLLKECEQAGVNIYLNTTINNLNKVDEKKFVVKTSTGDWQCESVVIATGGLSIPTMGATAFGYKIAEQFNIKIWPTRAALVPLTLHTQDKDKLAELSGIAVDSLVSNQDCSFRENILFTHRGISGPAILQISSYWQPGEAITINLLPTLHLMQQLKIDRQMQPQRLIKNKLSDYLPKRLVEVFLNHQLNEKKLGDLSNLDIEQLSQHLNAWLLKPNGTEGYRTAEVTLGGVDCDAISSKTLEANNTKGLYFIGEVLDVTGWLGGHNFQWAWSSGWAAGQVV